MSATLDEISNSKIVDAEWNFGVTASSSEMKVVGTTYLHLKLLVESGNGTIKTLHFEMTLPQFYSFLHELERAKSSLEYLT
ncbi:hypothetical protein J437_LFUL011111 [Ladona fulva]|uniref:COMM domain-containing protein n=1 Tax=Ladona fulva TaxID=123851 RepID=A0A8K0KA90_LADFU|nr:hypothetical protein J437_LFUL011111 [Ladona fulva]